MTPPSLGKKRIKPTRYAKPQVRRNPLPLVSMVGQRASPSAHKFNQKIKSIMPAIKLSPSRRAKPTGAKPLPKNGANGNGKQDFAVRDLSLAEWGRKTIQVSEHEMPGL